LLDGHEDERHRHDDKHREGSDRKEDYLNTHLALVLPSQISFVKKICII
jgi:hypothetical protein